MKSGLTSQDAYERGAERREDAPDEPAQARAVGQDAGDSGSSRRRRTWRAPRYDLNKVRSASPIDGMVTKRNIEEGETAMVGTMNNAGTVLLTDRRHVGHPGRNRGRRDRHPVRHDRPAGEGHHRRDARQDVPRQGHRSRQQPDRGDRRGSTTRATNFKVVVTIDGDVPNVRPGFTCTAVDHDRDAPEGAGVPIQAMTRARNGRRRRRPDRARRRARDRRSGAAPTATDRGAGGAQAGPDAQGNRRRVRRPDGQAVFAPVKTGIAGEKYFEVLDGLKEGDRSSPDRSSRCAR